MEPPGQRGTNHSPPQPTIPVKNGFGARLLFLGIIAVAVILCFGWSNWLLLLPAALGIGAFLYQMNILIVASELRRRSKEPEEREETETPRRLTPEEIDERKRTLVFMKSHYDILVAQIAKYVEEHPDVSPEDAADYVSEKCFLEYEIAQLKGEAD